MQVTLTKVFRDNVDTRYGMRAKVAIQVDAPEYRDRWISALLQPNRTFGTENWEPGDIVSIDISTKGDFLNFKPNGAAAISSGPSIEERVSKLEASVFGEGPVTVQGDVIQTDDLPEGFDEDAEDDGPGF